MIHRSENSHPLKKRAFPRTARLRREKPFRSADDADWRATDRLADGPAAMQRWAVERGIETRPAPEPYRGPMLGVANARPA